MVFDEFLEPISVWRMVASGINTDPAWTLITTISGRCEPVQGNEEFLNNQSFVDVTETGLFPIDYASIIKPSDGLVTADGVQRRVVGAPEIWKWLIPHVACKLKHAQWDMTT